MGVRSRFGSTFIAVRHKCRRASLACISEELE